MINPLLSSEAPELVTPRPIASANSAPSGLLTVKVVDVAAVRQELPSHGIQLLNGSVDRPWGRRTATFQDPDGTVR